MFYLLFGVACLLLMAYWLVLFVQKKGSEAMRQEMEYLMQMSELAVQGELPESELKEGMAYIREDRPWRTVGWRGLVRIVEPNTLANDEEE